MFFFFLLGGDLGCDELSFKARTSTLIGGVGDGGGRRVVGKGGTTSSDSFYRRKVWLQSVIMDPEAGVRYHIARSGQGCFENGWHSYSSSKVAPKIGDNYAG